MILSIREAMKDIGVFIREPQTRWERFMFLFFRKYQWARRLLGGRWELYVHDKGTLHYHLIWFWVVKWSENRHGYLENTVGKETYIKWEM